MTKVSNCGNVEMKFVERWFFVLNSKMKGLKIKSLFYRMWFLALFLVVPILVVKFHLCRNVLWVFVNSCVLLFKWNFAVPLVYRSMPTEHTSNGANTRWHVCSDVSCMCMPVSCELLWSPEFTDKGNHRLSKRLKRLVSLWASVSKQP